MLLINCKVELKLKWSKYFVFSAGGTKNVINENGNANNVIFTIKDTKLQQETIKSYSRIKFCWSQ